MRHTKHSHAPSASPSSKPTHARLPPQATSRGHKPGDSVGRLRTWRNAVFLVLLVLVASVGLARHVMLLMTISLDGTPTTEHTEYSPPSFEVVSQPSSSISRLANSIFDPMPMPVHSPPEKRRQGWEAWLERLKDPNEPRYIIVDVKNGLGNRLRALCSALSVAASLRRRVLLLWHPDLHCNCSFASLFQSPFPFSLLEEEIPRSNLSSSHFQVYNYMRPEPGAIKDEEIFVDPRRHIYFKSGFVMNHYRGQWKFAQRYLQPPFVPPPVHAVASKLVSDHSMVGLHVRNVFDAPRDAASASDTTGASAIEGAEKEYGKSGSESLLKWRKASHWTNFVTKMAEMLREHAARYPPPLHPPLKFYLAADSAEAYEGLSKRFGDAVVFTRRDCSKTGRCDFRDCESMIYSLVDLMNLARTKLILGSGYSSYSEVAARMGGTWGRALPIMMAGKDFGEEILLEELDRLRPKPKWMREKLRREARGRWIREERGEELPQGGPYSQGEENVGVG